MSNLKEVFLILFSDLKIGQEATGYAYAPCETSPCIYNDTWGYYLPILKLVE
jgi:hypothetical protein